MELNTLAQQSAQNSHGIRINKRVDNLTKKTTTTAVIN